MKTGLSLWCSVNGRVFPIDETFLLETTDFLFEGQKQDRSQET